MKKYIVVWSQRIGPATVEHRDEIAAYSLRGALDKWECMSYCNACVTAIYGQWAK